MTSYEITALVVSIVALALGVFNAWRQATADRVRLRVSFRVAVGYLMGVVLAAMVPEKKEAIFVRTQEFGESRLVCGVHYPTDVAAGRIAGTVLAAVAMSNADYQRDFAAARAELRAALGY